MPISPLPALAIPASLEETPGETVLLWLTLSAACALAAHIAWSLEVLQPLIELDSSRITPLILVLYVACVCHGGWRAISLSQQHAALRDSIMTQAQVAGSWFATYRSALRAGGHRDSLNEVLSEQVRGSHEFGWFMAGAMLKLGLVGTVVGFMLMLGAINSLSVREFADLPEMLARMGSGMGTALYTTLVGLAANLALALQYLLLDRSADRYMAVALLSAAGE